MNPVSFRLLSVVGTVVAALLLAGCAQDAAPPSVADTTAADGHTSGRAAGASGASPGGAVPGSRADANDGGPERTSELHVSRTETFYDVTGRTERALLRDLSRRGPRTGERRHFGRTAWTARWEITYAQSVGEESGQPAPGTRCRVERADVYLDVEVTLPRWEAPSAASATLRRDWKQFLDALALHEHEHQESITSAGRRVAHALERLDAPSCTLLEGKAERKARAIIEQARRYNRAFDERTNHGQTQGARWPQ